MNQFALNGFGADVRCQMSDACSQAVARGALGELKVAYFGTAIYQCLLRLLKTFLSNTPSATVSITQMSKDAQFDGLFSGAIDRNV